MIEVELPDGRIVEIDTDDPQVAAGAARKFVASQASAQSNSGAKGDLPSGGTGPSVIDQVSDVVQSAGTGLRAGAEALIGLPGDAQELVGNIYEGARGLLVDETPEERARRDQIAAQVSAPGLPTTEGIRGVTNAVIGEPRQPETVAGDFAKTIGEFVPATAAGPGSVIRKGALAVAAGGGSEGAGQLTEGTDVEPIARAVGAIAGGLAGAGRINRAAKQALKSAPPEDQLKNITDTLYKTIRQAGIKYNPAAYQNAAEGLAIKLHSQGFRSGTAPKAFSIVDELIENVGKQLDFDDLDSVRRAAGKVLTSPDETERAVARIVVEAIDDFSLSAPIINTAGRASKDIRQLVLRARDFASRNIKQRQLNEAIEIASTRRAGFEAGLRNEFDKLLKGKKGRGWTPQERAEIRSVANGTIGRNAVRFLSKFGLDFSKLGSNNALIPGGAFGAGALAGEPLAATALVTAGTLARPVARAQTKAAAEQAKKLVRAGKRTQARLGKAEQAEALKVNLRRLLVGSVGASGAVQ